MERSVDRGLMKPHLTEDHYPESFSNYMAVVSVLTLKLDRVGLDLNLKENQSIT